MKYKRLLSSSGILLAAVLAAGLITISDNLFTGLRLDLTENRLFTLSPGSANIIASLEEPVSLDFYLSRKTMADFPQLVNYANRVRDLLEEYAAKSDGKIELSVIEPEPFSEEEDQAVASGLNGISVNAAGDRAYFGLVGVNSTDDEAVIPFFQASREDALEYDITKLIYNLAHPDKRVVGVMSGLPLFGDPERGLQRWSVIGVMEEFFEVRNIDAGAGHIDEDVNVLMVVHPKDFTEQALFAIDQYLLRGGHAMLFVDPLAEGDSAEPDPENPYVMPELSSNLNVILEGWGLDVDTGKIAGDVNLAMRVQTQGARGPQESNYLPWLRIEAGNLNREDFSTSELNLVHVGTAGIIGRKEGEEVDIDVTPLIQTTADSMKMERDLIFFQRDPNVMLANFESGNTPLVLAARISGTVPSAYPDGLPGQEETEAAKDIVREGRVDVVLVGDTDILADHFWIRKQNFFGVEIPQSIANNGDFVVNTLDNLAGNTDLISLRSRGEFSRPFTVVEEIRRDAEARFRAQEQALQARLQETEQKIAQLQQEGGEGTLLLSQEQAAEIEKFKLEQIRTRKELRAVQHELQKNIERLGTQLKFINTGLIPLVIGMLSLLAVILRARRKIS